MKFTGFSTGALNIERHAGPRSHELWVSDTKAMKEKSEGPLSGLGEEKGSGIISLMTAAWCIATGNNFHPGLVAQAYNSRYLAG